MFSKTQTLQSPAAWLLLPKLGRPAALMETMSLRRACGAPTTPKTTVEIPALHAPLLWDDTVDVVDGAEPFASEDPSPLLPRCDPSDTADPRRVRGVPGPAGV